MTSAPPDPASVDLDTMLPDLFDRYPPARRVFDRYGLRGCGGPNGPHESVGFFARTHGVPEERLLEEIREAMAVPDTGCGCCGETPSVADAIYRPYFTAGIVAILTAGATWGAWLLWRIGFAREFTALSIHDVNAHGHAQIFGWLGLFVMGFAYQAFPRIWHTSLAGPRLAIVALVGMLAGLVLRTAGMTLAESGGSPALAAAMAGAALECLAAGTFVTQVAWTFRRSGRRAEAWTIFVFTGLACFFLQAVAGSWHTLATMTAPSREALLAQVSTFQAPLRDLQIHGFALFTVVGVSMRMLPALFGLPEIGRRRARTIYGLLLVALAGEISLLVGYRTTGLYGLAAALLLPWTAMGAAVGLILERWRPWRPFPVPDRSAKFVRAAYGWLAVSTVLLLLLPVYQAVSGLAFSHAYYGAIRHAITVGFLSSMILGFAAKVVPTLNGIDPRGLSSLTGPFVLVNAGCLLRVTLQTLTDWNPAFFAMVGVSGLLEVAGIAWWGAHILTVIRAGRRAERGARPRDGGERRETAPPAPASTAPPSASSPEGIELTHRVADVLARHPATGIVFVRHGFGAIKNPVLRRTIAHVTSLEDACRLRGVDPAVLLADLREATGLEAPPQPAAVRAGAGEPFWV